MQAITFGRTRNDDARACSSAAETSAPKSARIPRSPAEVTFGRMRLMVTCRPIMANDHVHDSCNHSSILQDIARQAMIDRGLAPDFSDEAQKQADAIPGAADETDASIRDLRNLLW